MAYTPDFPPSAPYQLSPEAAKVFVEAITNPPEPAPALVKLLKAAPEVSPKELPEGGPKSWNQPYNTLPVEEKKPATRVFTLPMEKK
jgi:hypothetical protein